MLPISWMMRLDSSLNFIKFSGFPFRAWAFSSFFQLFLDFAHSLFVFQDYILCNSFNTEVDFKFSSWFISPLQFLGAGWLWIICRVALILFLLSFHFTRAQFPGAGRCTFRSVLLLLLFPRTFRVQSSVVVEASRVSLIKFSFPFVRNHSVDAICHHEIVHNNGIGPYRPELLSFVLRSGQIDPADSVVSSFPLTVIVDFLGFDRSSSGALSPDVRIEVTLNEHPRWNNSFHL